MFPVTRKKGIFPTRLKWSTTEMSIPSRCRLSLRSSVITGEVSPCPWDANFPSASQMSLPISCQDARGSWTGAPCPHASWRREGLGDFLGISFLHAGYAVVEQGPLREGFLKENQRALPGVFRDGGRAPPLSGLGTTFA